MKIVGKTGVIYGLFDARTNELRYIGKTTIDPAQRLGNHLKAQGRSYKASWIRSIGPENVRMEILEQDPPDLDVAERWWIMTMRHVGVRLTNLSDGGGGGGGLSQRLGTSRRWKGVPKTAEHNRRNAEAQRRRYSKLSRRDRSEIVRKGRSYMSQERRREIALRGHESRRREAT